MTVPSVEMLLIAARAVFLLFSFILAAVAFTRWRRDVRALAERTAADHQVVLQRLADLEACVAATNVAVSRLGERVERPQQLASTQSAPSPGYQIAIRLAKGGASREELIAGCGLSTHEAELVHRLHAPNAKPSARKPATGRIHAA
jgi:alkylation response protein AidB-like acyl-CoA dehydrogenase